MLENNISRSKVVGTKFVPDDAVLGRVFLSYAGPRNKEQGADLREDHGSLLRVGADWLLLRLLLVSTDGFFSVYTFSRGLNNLWAAWLVTSYFLLHVFGVWYPLGWCLIACLM